LKYLSEYRSPEIVQHLISELNRIVTRPWVIMEVCGGQTHSIVRNGLDQMLPDGIELVHGPGCPVCVTPLELVDRAIAIASRPGVVFVSFGDMLRVPGTEKTLLLVRSEGADVRIVYSPLQAVSLARDNPEKKVVFFAVGFETTVPAVALAVLQAQREGLTNFYLLVSHVLVPPAITALLDSSQNRVQGYLAAGHVCAVMGWKEYEPISEKYRVPIVVTGFEPVDLLEGILMVVSQLERGEARVENQYARVVTREGNRAAQEKMWQVFDLTNRKWRGMGEISSSGLRLRPEFSGFDAEQVFPPGEVETEETSECISGMILQGLRKPFECPAFGGKCTPGTPLGPTMVSSEGTCAAYFAYGARHKAGSR
jgi:hydrogenase expression/formation protein HypD